MEKMKSKTLIGAVLMLCLASMFTLALNIPQVKGATILSQNFDDEPTGSVPQGWVVENPSICSLRVNETVRYGETGKSARFMDHTTEGFSYVGRTFNPQYGSITLEFAMRSDFLNELMFYIDDGNVAYHSPNGANIYFVPDGSSIGGDLEYYDGYQTHPFGKWLLETWYVIKMVIDVPQNTYDVYVDDILKVVGAPFRLFGTVTQLSRIQFGATTHLVPIGHIDEISISSTTPPSPVPEFPLGSAVPLAAIPLLLYLWWKRKQKTPPQPFFSSCVH